MESSTWKIVAVLVAGLFGLCFHQQAMAQDLIIVGTGSTMDASQDWLSFLKTQEVPCVVVNPAEFGEHKKRDFVVVIGSMDESEDMKAILEEVLNPEELEWISQAGNGNMYVKTGAHTSVLTYMLPLPGGQRQHVCQNRCMGTGTKDCCHRRITSDHHRTGEKGYERRLV